MSNRRKRLKRLERFGIERRAPKRPARIEIYGERGVIEDHLFTPIPGYEFGVELVEPSMVTRVKITMPRDTRAGETVVPG